MVALYFPDSGRGQLLTAGEPWTDPYEEAALGPGALGENGDLSALASEEQAELPGTADLRQGLEAQEVNVLSTRRFRRALLHAAGVLRGQGRGGLPVRALLDTLSCPPHFIQLNGPQRRTTATTSPAQGESTVSCSPDACRALTWSVPEPMLWAWYGVTLSSHEEALLHRLLTVLRSERKGLRLEVWLLTPAQAQGLVPAPSVLHLGALGQAPIRVLRDETGAAEAASSSRSGRPLAGLPKAESPMETAGDLEAVLYHLRGNLPPVELALVVGERVRRALLSLRGQGSFSPTMVGKSISGSRLQGNQHAHFVPLDLDRDGRLDHALVFAPGGFSSDDEAALNALRLLGGDKDWGLGLTVVHSGSLKALRERAALSIISPSATWRSVTPFSLPFYATRGQDRPPRPRDLPEGQVRRELRSRGLPSPAQVIPLPGWEDAAGRLHPWESFQHVRRNQTRGNGLAGFQLEFAEPLEGPILLGFACHFGLGVFEPAR